MNILAVAGFAVAIAILAVLLRQYRPEFAALTGLTAGVMLLVYILFQAKPAFAEINTLLNKANVDTRYGAILLKSLGICFITQLAADTCADAGESAIASKIELAGKFAVLLVALPLFEQIAELAVNLIG